MVSLPEVYSQVPNCNLHNPPYARPFCVSAMTYKGNFFVEHNHIDHRRYTYSHNQNYIIQSKKGYARWELKLFKGRSKQSFQFRVLRRSSRLTMREIQSEFTAPSTQKSYGDWGIIFVKRVSCLSFPRVNSIPFCIRSSSIGRNAHYYTYKHKTHTQSVFKWKKSWVARIMEMVGKGAEKIVHPFGFMRGRKDEDATGGREFRI